MSKEDEQVTTWRARTEAELRKEIAYERATRVKNEMEAMRDDGRRDKRIQRLEERVAGIEQMLDGLRSRAEND